MATPTKLTPQILIVDDELDLLDLFAMILNRRSFRLLKAPGGREALNILETETPTLILLDVAMPDITGLDVLHAIRGNPRFSTTKIIILTAVPVMVDKKDSEMADLVLAKPISPKVLEDNILNLISM